MRTINARKTIIDRTFDVAVTSLRVIDPVKGLSKELKLPEDYVYVAPAEIRNNQTAIDRHRIDIILAMHELDYSTDEEFNDYLSRANAQIPNLSSIDELKELAGTVNVVTPEPTDAERRDEEIKLMKSSEIAKEMVNEKMITSMEIDGKRLEGDDIVKYFEELDSNG